MDQKNPVSEVSDSFDEHAGLTTLIDGLEGFEPKSSGEQPPESEDLEPEENPTGDEDEETLEESSEDSPESDEDEDEDDLPPAIQKMQKRINKLTARAKAAEEESERLKNEVSELKRSPRESETKPGSAYDLDNVWDPTKLAEIRAKAHEVMAFARKHRDGYYDEQSGDEFSAEQMATMLTNAEKMYYEGVPEREQYLRENQTANEIAKKSFPWLSKPNSPELKEAQRALAEFPEIRKRADWPVILGDLVEGRKLREQGPKAHGRKPINTPPASPGKAAAVPRTNREGDLKRNRIQRAIQDPTPEGIADFIDAMGI